MKYLYLACKLGVGHVNFTPSLTKVPALEALAESSGIPIAGKDGKTGQTLLKTVLAPAFRSRAAQGRGLVLHQHPRQQRRPGAGRSGEQQDQGRQQALGARRDPRLPGRPTTRSHIHYYRPRGDEKEAWDNIDVARVPRRADADQGQLPLQGLDPRRPAGRSTSCGCWTWPSAAASGGIQRQLSLFFKAPYHRDDGERAVNDLFKQYALLHEWVEKVARSTVRAAV